MTYQPAVIVGCGIGDALGMPFECRGCAIHHKLSEWDGKSYMPGTFHPRAAGQWTDDTEMTVALAKSLEKHGWDGFATATAYVEWINGDPTGAGSSTRNALKMLHGYLGGSDNHVWKNFGTQFESAEEVGSGTAMRASPIGLYFWREPNMLRKVCREDAYITHADEEAYAASLAVAATVCWFVRMNSGDALTRQGITTGGLRAYLQDQLLSVEDTLVYKGIRRAFECRQLGYDPETFADDVAGRFGNAWQIVSTSLYCLLNRWNGSFIDVVSAAIKLGGDADTRGAIAGAMAGAKVGLAGIPKQYIEQLFDSNMLLKLDEKLYSKS